MTKPFFERLETYFADVGRVLRSQSDTASIFANTTDIGIAREQGYANVLRQHLPAAATVSLGGCTFGLDGSESKQIDVLVTSDRAPRFDLHNADGTGKTFSCIDGCVAVASVKSYLSRDALREALANIASLPDKQPLQGRSNPFFQFHGYDDWPFKIIFAYDGTTLETCYQSLVDYYNEPANMETPFYKRPNLIHVAGKYWMFRSWTPTVGGDGREVAVGEYVGREDSTDIFGLLCAILNIQKIVNHSTEVLFSYDPIFERLIKL